MNNGERRDWLVDFPSNDFMKWNYGLDTFYKQRMRDNISIFLSIFFSYPLKKCQSISYYDSSDNNGVTLLVSIEELSKLIYL